MAFRVAPDNRDETLAYLREREQITEVYVEATRPVSLLDGSGRNATPVLRGRPGSSAICGPLSFETRPLVARPSGISILC